MLKIEEGIPLSTLDTCVPKVRAWARVLTLPSWWGRSGDDRSSFRSGVELAYWTNRQVRRSGLCTSCWMRESAPDPRLCEGARCRNFGRQDAVAAVER
ncbi:hypothetical protein AOB60_01085 [Streptomyces noursei]|uniref:Uncharacterized protein n=1 Tax=Streptomyces noursei TaxID=1971 RepID=A0A2N8PR73_STRNR|nr:hypothetical protein AOB60_01085 [Streptomyces noursei]